MRWATLEQVQIDRMASAWLIRRFVDADAEFEFVPRGTEAPAVSGATPFHMEGAELSRLRHIIEKYQLANDHPALTELNEIVRAADGLHSQVAFRGVPMHEAVSPELPPEAAGLQAMLHGVRISSPDDDTALSNSYVVMNALYESLRVRAAPAGTA